MERKLSEKATKIRHRLIFARSNSARGIESKPVSPIDASPSSSRPRSTTNPESPTHDELTWDSGDLNPEGGYSFTDEPGYFRPASPLINRQEIEEDLEADIKHACAMLSHSIDRGIPTGLTYPSAVPVRVEGQNPAGQPSGDAAPSSLKQQAILLSAPRPIKLGTGSTTKHDSGVGTSSNSPSQPGRPCDNSVSGTDTSARFYNKQPSASPPHNASPGRFRSQSLATTVEDNQRERANSSSPIPFPYSPPQSSSKWVSKPTTLDSPVSSLNEGEQKFEATESELETGPEPEIESATGTNYNKPETASSAVTPLSAPYLDAVGGACLRASRETHIVNEEKPTIIEPKTTKPLARFYSSCNQTTGSFNSCEWPTDFREDWSPGVYGKVSPASPPGSGRTTVSRPQKGNPRLATAATNEEKVPGRCPYQFAGSGRGTSYSSSCLADKSTHQERVYSVAIPDSLPKNNRRKKASLLLRKLAGLGARRKSDDNANEVR